MIDPHCDDTSESRQVVLAAIRHRAHLVEVLLGYAAFIVRLQQVLERPLRACSQAGSCATRIQARTCLVALSTATAVLTAHVQRTSQRNRCSTPENSKNHNPHFPVLKNCGTTLKEAVNALGVSGKDATIAIVVSLEVRLSRACQVLVADHRVST